MREELILVSEYEKDILDMIRDKNLSYEDLQDTAVLKEGFDLLRKIIKGENISFLTNVSNMLPNGDIGDLYGECQIYGEVDVVDDSYDEYSTKRLYVCNNTDRFCPLRCGLIVDHEEQYIE